MVSKKEVDKFVKSQESIHLYSKMQKALTDVLLKFPNKDFYKVTKNLQIISVQEGIIGQGMVFPNPKGKFKIISIVYIPKIPLNVLRFIIAHELGHIHHGRHKIVKGEDNWALERYANKMTKEWGFPPTKNIWDWITKYMKMFNLNFPKDFPKN